jgi:Domain of unknown function (DUF4333)
MTNPPHDGDEREAGAGTPPADQDQNLTQPVQYDRPSPHAGTPYGSPYGQSAPTPPQYGQPAQPYGQPAQPWQQAQPLSGRPNYTQPGSGQPGYGQPPGQFGQPGYGPTPYPAPGYGPQYGMPGQSYGPPRKPRTGLIAALTGLALLLVLAVVALVALQSTVLDPAAVERDVAAQFEQREGVAIDLTCTEEMEVEEGESYPCSGVTADGEEVDLQITITDEDSGAYTWTEP